MQKTDRMSPGEEAAVPQDELLLPPLLVFYENPSMSAAQHESLAGLVAESGLPVEVINTVTVEETVLHPLPALVYRMGPIDVPVAHYVLVKTGPPFEHLLTAAGPAVYEGARATVKADLAGGPQNVFWRYMSAWWLRLYHQQTTAAENSGDALSLFAMGYLCPPPSFETPRPSTQAASASVDNPVYAQNIELEADLIRALRDGSMAPSERLELIRSAVETICESNIRVALVEPDRYGLGGFWVGPIAGPNQMSGSEFLALLSAVLLQTNATVIQWGEHVLGESKDV